MPLLKSLVFANTAVWLIAAFSIWGVVRYINRAQDPEIGVEAYLRGNQKAWIRLVHYISYACMVGYAYLVAIVFGLWQANYSELKFATVLAGCILVVGLYIWLTASDIVRYYVGKSLDETPPPTGTGATF